MSSWHIHIPPYATLLHVTNIVKCTYSVFKKCKKTVNFCWSEIDLWSANHDINHVITSNW
jgi:hypothetical protein